MPRIRIWNGGASSTPKYEFTVVLIPVYESESASKAPTSKGRKKSVRLPNPFKPKGYQVTVPSLPGLITFGRTESEAWDMAADAIRCHVEGLKKDGVPVPDERLARFRKFRISA